MRKGLICFMGTISICACLLTGCEDHAPYIETANETSLAVDSWNDSAGSPTTTPTTIQEAFREETEPVTVPTLAESDIVSDWPANQQDIGNTATVPVIQATTPLETEPPEREFIEEAHTPVTEEPESTETESTESIPSETEAALPPTTEVEESTTPTETNPTEEIDLDVLVQYGLQYAASVHGYQMSPGVRDGYYPAYSCYFTTMEQGRAAIRGCVDDTTNAILAVPGTQIVAVIDGEICRARIDIVITTIGNGSYRISVFYG